MHTSEHLRSARAREPVSRSRSNPQPVLIGSRADLALAPPLPLCLHRCPHSVGRFTEMVMTEGKGSYLKTECGRTILDFTCGSASSLSLLSPRVPRRQDESELT